MEKRTNEEWRILLAEQQASGQTQGKWCAAQGINLYTLRDKASRLRKLDRSAVTVVSTTPPNWVEVKTNIGSAGTAKGTDWLTIEIGGARISAGAEYPVSELAALCRELIQIC